MPVPRDTPPRTLIEFAGLLDMVSEVTEPFQEVWEAMVGLRADGDPRWPIFTATNGARFAVNPVHVQSITDMASQRSDPYGAQKED